MKVQDLIGEVAKRHNVLVDPSDPVFIAVTLNELLLAEHLAKVDAALAQAEEAFARGSERQLEKARYTATSLVANTSVALAEQLKGAGVALRAQLQQGVRELVLTAAEAATVAARQKRAAQHAAVVAIASACAVVLMVIATWFARP
ncbi:MAG: hypothetical protein U0229_13280 [Anaeromyxobacter sp.]